MASPSTSSDEQSLSSHSPSNTRLHSSSSSSSTIKDPSDLLAAYDNAIKSFCPNILLNQINADGVNVRCNYFTGVCMLADISGFTKLSNELGKDGKNGLDQLRKATSGFLSKFIYLVYSYGGDVISFAGDALICLFCDEEGMLPCESKRKAIECGFKLKEHFTDQLSAHIAMTTGEMCFSLLGGYMNNWVYVMNGQCVQELSQCIDDAKSKELVISQDLYLHIPEHYRCQLEVSFLPSGNVLITGITQDSIEKMEEDLCFANRFETSINLNSSFTVGILGFLPTTVVSSMSAGSFKNISELRVVTTMFLKLDSYSPEKNADLSSLQSFFYMAQEAIYLSGGVLRQFLVDDKGCVLIALWGVPSASYANNASRALVCATTIRDKALSMDHATSIGITTGQCFCGTIGSILRRDYVAIGDSVNMAARLMSKADGRILVDDNSCSSLSSSLQIHMREGEPLNLKGRSLPLTPYIFACETSGDSDEESTTTRNMNLLSLNVSNQLATHITSLPSEDTVFMALPDLMARSSSKHRREQFEIDDATTSQLRSNLSPHIEKALIDHIKHLVNLQSNIMRYNSKKSGGIAGTNFESKCQLLTTRPSPLMKYVVVHGKQGTGKTEVTKYFRKLSLLHKVRCFYIKAKEDDLLFEYGVFRRLFDALIGSNIIKTSSEQKRCILSLLKITYPELPDKIIMKTKFPAVKDILGLEWDVQIVNGSLVGVSEQKALPRRQCFFMKYKCNLIMSELIRSLLMNIPSTIIIDDAHFCDPLTWRELSYLTLANLPLVSLFTMRPPLHTLDELEELFQQETQITAPQIDVTTPLRQQAMSKYGSFLRKFFRRENRVHPILSDKTQEEQTLRRMATSAKYTPSTSSPAAHACKHLVTSNPHGTRLTLDPLTPMQISTILCGALGRTKILPELVNIVIEVSTGNAYWVRLIADYVSQFGYESFMKSVGVTDDEDLEENAGDVSSPHTTSTNGNYAITSSFRQYGSLHIMDQARKTRKKMKKSQEHESNHLRVFIVSLVDQLSIEDASILKLASLIGVTFCATVLQQILPQTLRRPGLLESSLSSIESKGFVVRISSEGTFYQFQNHRLREIVYDFTPPSDASRLHYTIAQVTEKIHCAKIEFFYEALTYHYNNAIFSDTSMKIYKEALKYSLLTASLLLQMGNFSMALDYLEYAESIAQIDEEFLQIMKLLESAGEIVNLNFSTDPMSPNSEESPSSPSPHSLPLSTSANQSQIARMFYQRNTLGSEGDDFLYDDYLALYQRIEERSKTNCDRDESSPNRILSSLTPEPSQNISSPPKTSLKSYCLVS